MVEVHKCSVVSRPGPLPLPPEALHSVVCPRLSRKERTNLCTRTCLALGIILGLATKPRHYAPSVRSRLLLRLVAQGQKTTIAILMVT
jgi:hypothetical protein